MVEIDIKKKKKTEGVVQQTTPQQPKQLLFSPPKNYKSILMRSFLIKFDSALYSWQINEKEESYCSIFIYL